MRKPSEISLTHDRLLYLMRYEPETGLFIRNVSIKGHFAGAVVGGMNKGRLMVCVDGMMHSGSRLAWFYMTGLWPDQEVDHEDVNPSNNRWSNLRLATRSQNEANKKIRSDNSSGIKGIYFDKKTGLWRAGICVDSNRKHIGVFLIKSDAAAAYARVARESFRDFARIE